MSNKETAKKFLQLISLGHLREAFERFVAPDFIHHNQFAEGDRDSLAEAMAEAAMSDPVRSFIVKQSMEEGDRVMTYSHVMKQMVDMAVIHIFRFKEGKIVELWDLGQPVSQDTPNENGLF